MKYHLLQLFLGGKKYCPAPSQQGSFKSSKILEHSRFFDENIKNYPNPAKYWNIVVFSREIVKIFQVQQVCCQLLMLRACEVGCRHKNILSTLRAAAIVSWTIFKTDSSVLQLLFSMFVDNATYSIQKSRIQQLRNGQKQKFNFLKLFLSFPHYLVIFIPTRWDVFVT